MNNYHQKKDNMIKEIIESIKLCEPTYYGTYGTTQGPGYHYRKVQPVIARTNMGREVTCSKRKICESTGRQRMSKNLVETFIGKDIHEVIE